MARERYLVNAGEDTIHDPEAEKKAEAGRQDAARENGIISGFTTNGMW